MAKCSLLLFAGGLVFLSVGRPSRVLAGDQTPAQWDKTRAARYLDGRGENWFKFNNDYFRHLVHDSEVQTNMLPSDLALVNDPECAPWVKKYALSQPAFFADFAAAYVKMSVLGSSLEHNVSG